MPLIKNKWISSTNSQGIQSTQLLLDHSCFVISDFPPYLSSKFSVIVQLFLNIKISWLIGLVSKVHKTRTRKKMHHTKRETTLFVGLWRKKNNRLEAYIPAAITKQNIKNYANMDHQLSAIGISSKKGFLKVIYIQLINCYLSVFCCDGFVIFHCLSSDLNPILCSNTKTEFPYGDFYSCTAV